MGVRLSPVQDILGNAHPPKGPPSTVPVTVPMGFKMCQHATINTNLRRIVVIVRIRKWMK